jgi:prolyl oligopeptidase
MRERKQNVFDDFIACAEELVARGVTTPARLGAMGGSNGGLLVAAAVTQRPDLFRVGMSFVPLTDMLRYQRFRIGSLWIPEYGSADDEAHAASLRAYSPYHRVADGTRYPAVMFTSAEGDSRVDPMHARKMAARMQEAQEIAGLADERPIVLRIESKAGHGAGKPTTQLAEEATEELAFLFAELGMG